MPIGLNQVSRPNSISHTSAKLNSAALTATPQTKSVSTLKPSTCLQSRTAPLAMGNNGGINRLRAKLPNHKTEPYLSKNCDENVELNGEVELEGETLDSYGTAMPFCRHFVQIASEAPKGERRSNTLAKFSNEESIKKVFGENLAQINARYEHNIRSAPAHSKHLVTDMQFGKYLAALAAQLDDISAKTGEEAEVGAFLLTAEHVMHLKIQRKIEDDKTNKNFGRSYFAVSVFDPNATATHMRVSRSEPQELADLDLESMIDEDSVELYWVNGESIAVNAVLLDPELNLNLPQSHFTPQNTKDIALTTQLLSLAADGGAHEAILKIGKILEKSDNKIDTQKICTLLRAKLTNGPNGLLTMMEQGHLKSIQSYGVLLKANWDKLEPVPVDRFELVLDESSCSPLSEAASNGHPDCITAWGSIVSSLDLNEFEQELVCSSVGKTLRSSMFDSDNAKCISAIINVLPSIKKSSSAILHETLYMENSKGTPALHEAAGTPKNTSCIEAYCLAIERLQLSSKEKVFELLSATNIDELPAFANALQTGEIDNAKIILNSFTRCGVNPQDASNLMQSALENKSLNLSPEATQVLQDAVKEQTRRTESLTH
jgi:hypothetical protein